MNLRIPIFTGFLTEERDQDAWRLASDILNMVLVALLVACVLIAVLAEPLVAWTIGSGFDAPKRALTVHILRMLLVQPVLVGRRMQLNVVVTFLALMFGGWLWGLGGLFIAVPTLVVLKICADHIESLAPIGEFLGQ